MRRVRRKETDRTAPTRSGAVHAVPNLRSQFWKSDSGNPILGIRFPTSDSRHPIPDIRFPTSDSRHPIPQVRLRRLSLARPVSRVRVRNDLRRTLDTIVRLLPVRHRELFRQTGVYLTPQSASGWPRRTARHTARTCLRAPRGCRTRPRDPRPRRKCGRQTGPTPRGA